MRVAPRDDDNVAGAETRRGRRAVSQFGPARTRRQSMEADHMLGLGNDQACNHGRRWRGSHPRGVRLHVEENCPGQPDIASAAAVWPLGSRAQQSQCR